MSMTSVLGHLTNMDFPESYGNWYAVDPSELFTAEIKKDCVDSVIIFIIFIFKLILFTRPTNPFLRILKRKPEVHSYWLYGQIVTEKARQSVPILLNCVER